MGLKLFASNKNVLKRTPKCCAKCHLVAIVFAAQLLNDSLADVGVVPISGWGSVSVCVLGCPSDCPPARPVIGPNNFGIFVARSQRQRRQQLQRQGRPKMVGVGVVWCGVVVVAALVLGEFSTGSPSAQTSHQLPLPRPLLIPRSCDADTNLAY